MKHARAGGWLVLVLIAAGAPASAQPTPQQTAWEIHASAATYVFPDEDNYVQPTVAADRGSLHLESRYNYEERRSLSVLVGWNLEFGESVKLELTPMIGGVFGRIDGILPALEADFSWRRLEAYSETELMIDTHDQTRSFFYGWSEISIWATERFRAGGVLQRTRTYQTAREVQRGFLVGVTASRVEGTVYLFNPGADDQFLVLSLGIHF